MSILYDLDSYGPVLPLDMKPRYYGLGFALPENLNLSKPEDLAIWKSFGDNVRRYSAELADRSGEHAESGGTLAERKGLLAWALGDFLVAGVKGGLKPRALKKHVKETLGDKCPAWGTLDNYMRVSRKVEISRRREDLDYTHHLEVAGLEPEMQTQVLAWAVPERGHRSSREVKAYIASLKKIGKLPMTEKEKQEQENPSVVLHFRVSTQLESQLNAIARAKDLGNRPARALWWMAQQYFKENKEKIQAEVAAYNAAEETKRKELQERIEAQTREYNAPEKVAARQAKKAAHDEEMAVRREAWSKARAEGKSSEEMRDAANSAARRFTDSVKVAESQEVADSVPTS